MRGGQVAPVVARAAQGRRAVAILAWVAAAVVAAALVATGHAGTVLDVLRTANPAYVGLLFLVGLALPVVHARRWQLMLRSVRADVPLLPAAELTVTSSMVNYAVPGYTGSPTKGVLLRQSYGIGFGQSLPTLAAEQSLDVVVLVAGTGLALALAGPTHVAAFWPLFDRSLMSTILAGAAVLAGGLGLLGLLARRFGRRFTDVAVANLRLLTSERSQHRQILLLTVAYWGLGVIAVWAAAAAVDLQLSAGALLLLGNVPVLLGMLSPLPGGIGLREGAMAAIAAIMGVSVSSMVAAALLNRAILVVALPVFLLMARATKWRRLWR